MKKTDPISTATEPSGDQIRLRDEPTHPSIRIADRDGDVWARHGRKWGCLTTASAPQTWSDLWHVCGPLTFALNAIVDPDPADSAPWDVRDA